MHCLFLFFFFLSIASTHSQQPYSQFGGGEFPDYKYSSCLSDYMRLAIHKELDISSSKLKAAGAFNQLYEQTVTFDWPILHNPNLAYNCTYATVYHVDHFIPGAGSGFDYSCGGRLYSGHNGTDYHTWPFPWYLYQNDQVIAVAAADGIILVKADGQSDENCNAPAASWNAVYLGHADGSRSWYGHLKRNSLINKNIGQSVSKGEMLGVIASSGSSTTPHLHFEVYDSSNNRIDPYFGNCNMLNNQSWWTNQKPEREPTLNLIATHDAIPEHGCPSINEDPHFSNVFFTGDSVVTAIYFHDEMAGDTSVLTIKDPNSATWQSWSHVAPITSSKSFSV